MLGAGTLGASTLGAGTLGAGTLGAGLPTPSKRLSEDLQDGLVAKVMKLRETFGPHSGGVGKPAPRAARALVVTRFIGFGERLTAARRSQPHAARRSIERPAHEQQLPA